MAEKRGVGGIHVTGGGSLHLKNVAFVGIDRPFEVEGGGVAHTENVIVQKGPPASEIYARSTRPPPTPNKPEANSDDPFFGPKLLLAEGANVYAAELDELTSRFFEPAIHSACRDSPRNGVSRSQMARYSRPACEAALRRIFLRQRSPQCA